MACRKAARQTGKNVSIGAQDKQNAAQIGTLEIESLYNPYAATAMIFCMNRLSMGLLEPVFFQSHDLLDLS
jgi:hypothetical protein